MRERLHTRRGLALEDVEARSVEVTAVESAEQRSLVDDLAARDTATVS